PDNTLVLSGSLHFFSAGPGFGCRVQLQHPFLYNPLAGNLLLDIFNYQPIGKPAIGDYAVNVQAAVPDTVSHIEGTTSAQVGFLSGAGIITAFHADPVPEPSLICASFISLALFLFYNFRTLARREGAARK
ncbi:MAG TPA: hypothetical protein VGE41_04080, partial [Verrucomicrobiae bacterium]